jgi:hypothetical protein
VYEAAEFLSLFAGAWLLLVRLLGRLDEWTRPADDEES